ncbi:DNA polymerase III subunit delta [Frankliniella fusca]|uniref:DNA polymerase III subunit delta n=1 Tax=Frankliniella fusca TaxID=407009 RepID=A0AAE1LPV9_9NEOP|nr:DNA polymerase III subunit delta [Frankliniella fusca]
MYVMASIRFGLKKTHRYLEPGHTQMQCDAMHARIETHMKNTDVFSPSQWIAAMKTAKVNKPKYIVKEMSQEELFDFTDLASYQEWSKLKTSEFREVVIIGNEPGFISFKTHFDKESIAKQIIKPKRGRPVNWKTIALKRKYPQLFPVREDVLKGLQELCESGAIPPEHSSFYSEFLPSLTQQQHGPAVVDPPASDVSDTGSDEELSSESEGNESDNFNSE